jgi:hypothetical protein
VEDVVLLVARRLIAWVGRMICQRISLASASGNFWCRNGRGGNRTTGAPRLSIVGDRASPAHIKSSADFVVNVVISLAMGTIAVRRAGWSGCGA